MKYVLLGPLLRLLFRPRIEGLEHVPEEGAAIVAGNHLSFSDHFLMPTILRRRRRSSMRRSRDGNTRSTTSMRPPRSVPSPLVRPAARQRPASLRSSSG